MLPPFKLGMVSTSLSTAEARVEELGLWRTRHRIPQTRRNGLRSCQMAFSSSVSQTESTSGAKFFCPCWANGGKILGESVVQTLQLWGRKKGKLGTYAMKRVAAGAHLPKPWLFEPAKRPDDRADYCLGCSFLT